MKDIFISYKSEDYKIAKWVRDYLEKCGLSVWMAPEDIPGGSDYSEQIPVAITNCKALVLIYSQKAESSKWVRREVDQAIN
ncbi:MAG: toll/interleukin-1 receptor domain-containing protein, partial [Clostridia bacterium]|nr:toll/interleukin-1 receptor domain-containing protein [Clostridia bacterium]